MKNYKICLASIVALALSLTACLKEHTELVPELEGVPAGGLTGVQLVNVEDDVAELEISLFVVDHFGGFITGLGAEDFIIEPVPGGPEFSVTEVAEREDDSRGPFSSTLLFDQSGSINSTDPLNARIEAGTAFAGIVKGGDEAAVAAFASNGNYQEPFELLQPFTSSQGLLTSTIEGLKGLAGGGTPLYLSIYGLIPYTAGNGKNENRAVVAFTDGGDTDGGVSLQALIQEACANQTRIYTVGLGQGVNEEVLSQIAFETGGAVMLAEDALQLISLYSSLGDLLHGEARVYHLQVEVKRASANWSAGDVISGAVSLALSANYAINLPFQVAIAQADVGEWYEKLPPCPCTYDEAKDLLASVCTGGEWLDCGKSDLLQQFHYGATYEVRWAPGNTDQAGQQCTYDSEKRLITRGIAAGSPDRDSPDACAGLEGFDPGHIVEDVVTWQTKPCWQYLRDWPANNAGGCAPDNPVTDIRHMLNMVGDMDCAEVTALFMIVDNTTGASVELKDFIHGKLNYTPANLVSLLTDLQNKADCDNFNCDVIETAIENLQ